MEKNLSSLKNIKKYLLKNMFSDLNLKEPKLRFNEFDSEIKVCYISNILKESKIKGKDNLEKRLSVKLHLNGIYKREIKSVEKEGATTQYIRRKGQFIYGKQNLHNGAFGIIPDYLDNYLSSSDIPSFDFIDNTNKLWFLYYLSNRDTYSRLENYSNGTGSKRISPETFLNLRIKIPSKKEQDKIVTLIHNLEIKIDCLLGKINNYKSFKKILLYKMFC